MKATPSATVVLVFRNTRVVFILFMGRTGPTHNAGGSGRWQEAPAAASDAASGAPPPLVGGASARIGDLAHKERQPRFLVHNLVAERPVEA